MEEIHVNLKIANLPKSVTKRWHPSHGAHRLDRHLGMSFVALDRHYWRGYQLCPYRRSPLSLFVPMLHNRWHQPENRIQLHISIDSYAKQHETLLDKHSPWLPFVSIPSTIAVLPLNRDQSKQYCNRCVPIPNKLLDQCHLSHPSPVHVPINFQVKCQFTWNVQSFCGTYDSQMTSNVYEPFWHKELNKWKQ